MSFFLDVLQSFDKSFAPNPEKDVSPNGRLRLQGLWDVTPLVHGETFTSGAGRWAGEFPDKAGEHVPIFPSAGADGGLIDIPFGPEMTIAFPVGIMQRTC